MTRMRRVTSGHGDSGLDREILLLGAVVVLGTIMTILDVTIVNIALQALVEQFDTPIGTVQWVVTAYTLAIATVIPITGWAARRLGTRRLYLATLALFTVGSVLCGIAWSISSLIAFRIVQGLAGGMLMPAGMIILARAAGPRRFGSAFSAIGASTVVAPVLGPVLGGLLVEAVGWRWIFFANVPIGIIGIVLTLAFLPPGHAESAGRLDWRGVVLVSSGLATLTYGLAEAGSGLGFGAPRVLAPTLAGIVLTAAFVRHSLRSLSPLLNVRLFRKPAFAAASATTFALAASLFGVSLLLPLTFQIVRGESVVRTGLLLIPQGLGAASLMLFTGRLADRFGGGILAFVSVLVAAAATLPLVFVADTMPTWVIETVLLVRGIGIGIGVVPAMSAAYSVLRTEEIADATPQLTVVQRVGGSIGTAVLAVVVGSALAGTAGAEDPAAAFSDAYTWALGMTLAGLAPAFVLVLAERRGRRAPPQRDPQPA